jgi:hypothetical protein
MAGGRTGAYGLILLNYSTPMRRPPPAGSCSPIDRSRRKIASDFFEPQRRGLRIVSLPARFPRSWSPQAGSGFSRDDISLLAFGGSCGGHSNVRDRDATRHARPRDTVACSHALSRKRELNCSTVLEDIFASLQCSRGFRLFRTFSPCGARASASLFSRVGGQHSQPRHELRRSKIGECTSFIRCNAPATATRFALRLHC